MVTKCQRMPGITQLRSTPLDEELNYAQDNTSKAGEENLFV